MHVSERAGAKVLLVSDYAQLQSVDAVGSFSSSSVILAMRPSGSTRRFRKPASSDGGSRVTVHGG